MKIFVASLLAFLSFTCTGQDEKDLPYFKGMSMRHIGPAGMSGRATSIDVVRANPEVIYVATASGGLWKSESGGITWEPIFDDQPCQSIGAVAIDQHNPSIIWAGTGEGNPRNSHSSGCGLYKSMDGGKNWTSAGLRDSKTIHRIIVDPNNSDIVYVGAMGSVWGKNEQRGVFKTTDGGKTWKKVLYVNDGVGCADMIMDPTNPNKIVAAMWEFGREPWFFNSGGEGSGLYITFDGGDTWEQRTAEDGLPKGNLGRIGLAVSDAKPNLIYALVEAEKTGLYKSEDGGFEWELISTKNIGNRPFYYADIYVDPKDEKEIWNLWSMVSKSEDGGKTFETVMTYSSAHPDHHAFYIHPDNPDFMIDGNDGGINISRDGGETWEFITNLPVGQFYHINHDMEVPYNVMGGMQDNGSWVGPAYAWQQGPLLNSDWQEVLFGDGFDVMPSQAAKNEVFGMYQGGNVYRINTETGAQEYIQPTHPDGENLRFNWNAAIAQNPWNDCGIYFGSQYVHYSKDCGKSWEIISPDLTTNDPEHQKQAESGGLTIDATQAENFTTITCIAPSANPLDKGKVIYVGSDDGLVHVTKDGGESWTEVTAKIKGFPKGAWIPQIHVSEINEGEAFIAVNDYRRNNWKAYAYHTKDYGKTWKRIADNNKVSGHVHTIVQDPKATNMLFMGTERGLWVSFNTGTDWKHWQHNYPTVPTIDLKIHPTEHDLIIGTFGRAAYILDDITPLRTYATKLKSVATLPKHDSLELFVPPAAYVVARKRPAGHRFLADHSWKGANRTSRLRIQYGLKTDKTEKSEDKEKVTFYVLQGSDTLRVFEDKNGTTGLNRTNYWLDRKGIHYPSRKERDPEDDKTMGGGPALASGTYKLVAEWGNHKDSTQFEVKLDPRMASSVNGVKDREQMIKDIYEIVGEADALFEKMKAAKKSINLVQSNLTALDDTTYNAVKDTAGVLLKRLGELEELYMLPADAKGYYLANKLTDHLYKPMSYVGSAWNGPLGQNARTAVQKARMETDKVKLEVEAFFKSEFEPWRAEAAKVPQASPFKKMEELEEK